MGAPEVPVPGAGSFTDREVEVLRARAASLAAEAEREVADDRLALLMFSLGEEWYGVRVGEVRELYNEYEITPIPCVPDYVLGVINIRGEIISVTDVAAMMHLPVGPDRPEDRPAIVVRNDTCLTAMVVDEIGDIVEVPQGSLEPPLATIDKFQAEYVSGSVYVDDRLVAIVNLDRVLAPIGVGDAREG